MYVGDSETVEWLATDRYEVFKFTEDSIFRYQTTNADYTPLEDPNYYYYYYETTYILKYPDIEINAYPWPAIVTMSDTITIELYGNIFSLL